MTAAMQPEEPFSTWHLDGINRYSVESLMAWAKREFGVERIEVAEAAGMTVGTLDNRLSGRSKAFKGWELWRLSKFFGVPLTWLYEGPKGPPPPRRPSLDAVKCAVRDLNPEPAGSVPARLRSMAGGRRPNEQAHTRQLPLLTLVDGGRGRLTG